MKDQRKLIRGFTEAAIRQNIAMEKQRYPQQTLARDQAVALNIAEDAAVRADRLRTVRRLARA